MLAAALALGALGARAQDAPDDDASDADFELTITLLPPGATQPDAVTRRIELPPAVVEQGNSGDAEGLETAEEVRERRAVGLENAAEAVERGRELGEAVSEQARETRENAGRGEPPDPPNRPERPDPPGSPPGQ